MTPDDTSPVFPEEIVSARLGLLRLARIMMQNQCVHRHYEPIKPIVLSSRRVRLDSKGVTLVIWIPDSGIPDVQQFVAIVESRFDDFVKRIDRILEQAHPAIEDAIAEFWQIPNEQGPTVNQLLDTGEITQLNLNSEEESHELIIFDRAGLIGSHHLVLILAEDFFPASAYFDG